MSNCLFWQCLAASAEVKSLAEKAQTDLSMDYAWLDDVTYDDWQRYHELMGGPYSLASCYFEVLMSFSVYQRFDEQVRLIQNGSHPSPPIDPLPPALDTLQDELNEVIEGWETSVRSINGRALNEVFVEQPEAAEPDVSILPIQPELGSGAQGEFDASQVVIGKSSAQIEEALKDIPVVHEEL